MERENDGGNNITGSDMCDGFGESRKVFSTTLEAGYNVAICPRRMRLYKRHDVIIRPYFRHPRNYLVLGTINFITGLTLYAVTLQKVSSVATNTYACQRQYAVFSASGGAP